ncbi:MAG TPA: bifunctional glycosyltransferase family 2/GtrA family protein [Lachnospiraceae bacterium]|nr:bifunctional glycosyltransferase family 2/GtrA family protein [Lachnospiraceae bacterium]
MQYNQFIVVIPAYDPDECLINLIKEIRSRTQFNILIVNDGSSHDTSRIFETAKEYAMVLTHERNMGKGQAIKTALKSIQENYENSIVVFADADGQHRIEDIIKVCQEVTRKGNGLLIGSRRFTGKVPARSQFGNTVTRHIFRLVSGVKVQDTQTGLRAYRTEMIPFFLSIEGCRYEYEMNVLLACARNKIPIFEIPIETVYLDGNQCSHFHAVKDSIRIYKEILKFSLSSFASFLIDFLAFSLFLVITGSIGVQGSLLISNIFARIISSSANFFINRNYVFKNGDSLVKTAIKYFSLVIAILALNTMLLTFLVENITSNQLVAKVMVEVLLFFVSWWVQKLVVFPKSKKLTVTK